MPQTRKKPAKKPSTPSRAKRGDLTADEAPIVADAGTIRQAIEDLGINRPFYSCRVVGSRLEFSMYGGDLIFWPPKRTRKK